MGKKWSYREPTYAEPQVPDYHVSNLSEHLAKIVDSGRRASRVTNGVDKSSSDVSQKQRRRLFPTNSERMNRALKELGSSAFKVHMLLWQWRGAPAKGNLPYFTIHSLSKFCSLTRPTIRGALKELTSKGWIRRLKYNKHKKNQLYRLMPIRDVEERHPRPQVPGATGPKGPDGPAILRPGSVT